MRRLTRRQRLAAIALAVVAAAFLTLDVSGGSLRSAHNGVAGALGALYRGTDGALGPVRRFLTGVPHAAADVSRLDAVEQQNRALRARVRQLEADRASARAVARLQLTADTEHVDVVPARVVALAPALGFDWTLTVDAGSADGARVGQTVTDGYGLVGRVVRVNASSSVVLLAVDPGAGVGVRDLRSGELGVVTGAATAGYTLRPLLPNASIKAGDSLETGPAGRSSYVAGIAVGTVRSVSIGSDGTVAAAVSPATSPTALDVVGLLLARPAERGSLAAGTGRVLRPAKGGQR